MAQASFGAWHGKILASLPFVFNSLKRTVLKSPCEVLTSSDGCCFDKTFNREKRLDFWEERLSFVSKT